MKRFYKDEKFWLLSIIILGALLRLYKINSPILDLYPMRQEQCAMIARNFFLHGFNIFNPEIDWLGRLDSSWHIELPLVSYLASFFYPLFGIHEFFGRIISILFSLGSIYLIFRFAGKLFNRKVALCASVLFAVSPLSVYFGRAFISDTAMLFFSIASLYYFYSWIDSGNRVNYILALITASLAFLLKLTSLYLCLPLFYIVYSKYRNKIFSKLPIYIFFLAAILVTFLWYKYSCYQMFSWFSNKSANSGMLTQPHFYIRIFESVSIFVLTPIGTFLALFGLFLPIGRNERYLLHFWLLAIIAYTLTAAGPNYVHYYYQLPFVPVFCILAAKAMDKVTQPQVWKETLFCKLPQVIILPIVVLTMLIGEFFAIRPFYNWSANTYNASKAVNVLTEKDAVVIAGKCANEAPLYYTGRKGFETNDGPTGLLAYSWVTALDKYNFPERKEHTVNKHKVIELPDEIELIKFLIGQGADYYFTTNMHALRNEPQLKKFLYDNFKLIKEEEGFVIFDLRK